jgi:monoamine oxidase
MRSARSGWQATQKVIAPLVRAYKTNEEEWNGPIAETIAGRSIGDWLNETKATREVRATAMTMRNFFVADPDDLSLLVYVDQFAAGGNPAPTTHSTRLRGGNDRLAARMARSLRSPVRLRHVVRRIAHTKTGVRVTVENGRRRSELSATCALVTAPAPLAAEIEFAPDLAEAQRDAPTRLNYRPVTKTLLQFDRASWRQPGKRRVRNRSRSRRSVGRRRKPARAKRHARRARRRRYERGNPEFVEKRRSRRAGLTPFLFRYRSSSTGSFT